jgi:hypothetical protein
MIVSAAAALRPTRVDGISPYLNRSFKNIAILKMGCCFGKWPQKAKIGTGNNGTKKEGLGFEK